MDNFLNQMRGKFTGAEENKVDHGGSGGNQKSQIQKTQPSKDKRKGRNWFPKFARKMSEDYDSREMEHAAAIAAAAFAIDSQQEVQTPDEASLTKTKSKLDGTKSLLGSASKRFSGSFRSTDEQGNKKAATSSSSFRDEKKPEKAITPSAPSMKKSSTFTDKKVPPQPPIRPPTPHPDHSKRQTTTTPTGPAATEADAWQRTQLLKIKERHDKLKETIDSWEKKKKMKAKRKLNKEESELERRRLIALEIFQTNMKYIDDIASGARSKAEERRRDEELKAVEKAMEIRKTGKVPGICSCF